MTAYGGSVSYDFNSDPFAVLALSGQAQWIPGDENNGNNGYLSVTESINSQRSAIVFDDFDNGLVVKAFSFSMDVRIGGGTGNPADGFSVNYVRANDPVLADPLNGWAAGWNGEGNLPEEGSTTGLAIGFDAYDSGGDGSGVWPQDDIIGVSVRLDNVLLAQYRFPTINGSCTDTNSLQTGPQDPDNPDQPTLLCWQPFTVNLTEAGKLTVTYKGREVTPAGGLQVNFVPSPGRLVFVARTGGERQNHHVDNIQITTVASTQPTVGQVVGNPSSFTFDILDAGTTTANAASVKVSVNGTPVTATANKAGATTTVSYDGFPALFASGSTNLIGIGFLDNNGNTNSVTRQFVVGAYNVVPPAFMAPAGSVSTATRGFKIRTHQSATPHNNSLALVELQLAGLRGENQIDTVTYPLGTDGFFTQEYSVINFDKVPSQQGTFPNEEQIPGFPGNYTGAAGDDNYENATMEVLTYIEFPAAGVYRMGVDSDDGFRVSTSKSAADKLGLVLGSFDGGRGADGNGTQFTFVIQQAGIYPVRLIWMNGGGGSNVEWFSILPDGTKILVNDTTEAASLKAYRNSTVPAPVPYVSLVNPAAGQTALPATTSVRAQITDGTSLTVNQGSIVMSLNGTALTPTVTKSGAVTTVAAVPPSLLGSNANNVVTLVFSDNGTPATSYTNTWSFTTAPYTILPSSIASPIGSGDATKPGFRVKTHQIDNTGTTGWINRGVFAEQILLGLFFPNVANQDSFVGGYFSETGVVNYTIDTAQGNFGGETAVPGIPGTTTTSSAIENFALEIQTFVEFPTAGFYSFGFNSDDGFRTMAAERAASIHALTINSPAVIAGPMGAVPGGFDLGGIANPLPLTPITAKVVYANPPLADTALVNAAEIAGNIALIDRGVVGFSLKLQNALAAGAVGVIIANSEANAGNLPIVLGGDRVAIPAVMISYTNGLTLKTNIAAAGGVNASLGYDPTPLLGQFDDGRGASDTIYNVVVPTPGVYPLRTVYFQGGGGGNAEWFSVLADGTKVLLNDTATTGHLKTFQARTVAATPTIGIAGTVITFTGTLQSSDTVNGTYTDVTGATSPFTIPLTGNGKFYRTRN